MPALKTTDMTFAAWLAVHGVEPSQLKLAPSGIVLWEYEEPETNEDRSRFTDLCDLFNRREAKVEPVAFHRCLAGVRRAMNEILATR